MFLSFLDYPSWETSRSLGYVSARGSLYFPISDLFLAVSSILVGLPWEQINRDSLHSALLLVTEPLLVLGDSSYAMAQSPLCSEDPCEQLSCTHPQPNSHSPVPLMHVLSPANIRTRASACCPFSCHLPVTHATLLWLSMEFKALSSLRLSGPS